MSARILDGREISRQMRAELKTDVDALRARGVVPGLGVLLVGDNPASRSYVTAKEKACEETGLHSREINLPATATRAEILDVVNAFNADPAIDGILVQLPLPDSSIEQEVIAAISPDKDVDGFHPVNVGRMMLGLPAFLPCTPHGVLHLIARSGTPAKGALISATRRKMSGRTSAHQAATEAPKSCPTTASTERSPSAASSPTASRAKFSMRKGARSPS